MGKIIFLCIIFNVGVYAGESLSAKQQLQNNCLQCHIQEQIPSELIYRRYLMKNNNQNEMQKAIFNYLKDPKKENSIMHPPFFFKFPMKEALKLDDETLEKNIDAYLDTGEEKKKLNLP